MGTLLFVNANGYDVQIVHIICNMIFKVTLIVAICYFLVQFVKTIYEWKKNSEIGKASENACGNIPNDGEKAQKQEMQKEDRAKALVKDFYEVSDGKNLETVERLISMYKDILCKQKKDEEKK